MFATPLGLSSLKHVSAFHRLAWVQDLCSTSIVRYGFCKIALNIVSRIQISNHHFPRSNVVLLLMAV